MSESNFTLSETSTKEEVAEYLCTTLNLNDEIKNLILSEYLTGDILPLLTKEELRAIGFKLGPAKRINKEIFANLDKFKDIKIDVKIYPNSSSEEVKKLFVKNLDFQGEINSLDGKGLLTLDEEGMKNIGLKYGQRKRLIKYIEYFKTLEPPKEEINISRKSSSEEVSKFLKLKLKFPQEIIDDLGLDGESLFDLEEKEINEINEITPEQKENLKQFIKKESMKLEEISKQKEETKEKEADIKITKESKSEDVLNFLRKKLNFSDEAVSSIKEQQLEGRDFLDLTQEEIKDFENVSEQEKEKLIIYLKENNNQTTQPELKIDNKSSKEDVVKFLKDKLNFSENTLKDWKLDGQALLSLIETEIEKLKEISQEEKNKLKKFISENKPPSNPEKPVTTTIKNPTQKTESPKTVQNDKVPQDNKKISEEGKEKEDNNEIKLSKESKKEDIVKFLEKRNLKLENLTEKDINEMKDIKNEEKDIIKTFLNQTGKLPKNNIDNNVSDEIKIKKATKLNEVLYNKLDINPKTFSLKSKNKKLIMKRKENKAMIEKSKMKTKKILIK